MSADREALAAAMRDAPTGLYGGRLVEEMVAAIMPLVEAYGDERYRDGKRDCLRVASAAEKDVREDERQMALAEARAKIKALPEGYRSASLLRRSDVLAALGDEPKEEP